MAEVRKDSHKKRGELVALRKTISSLQVTVGDLIKKESAQESVQKRRFQELVKAWRSDRGLIISIEKMAMHPAYQQIIAMGPVIVPLLLAELERETDHWFWALHVLTGVNPVSEECSGKIDEMAEAWISWGKQHGYEW